MGVETPQDFKWDAERSVMVPQYPKRADRQYVDGEHYHLGVIEDRSTASHNHYFAALHEAWVNLPEEMAMRFPTVEHLRKWALIQAGFCIISDFTCADHHEAMRLASFLKTHEPYLVTVVEGNVVSRVEARSQSRKEMDKKTFAESKEKVLEVLAKLLEVSKEALSKASAA